MINLKEILVFPETTIKEAMEKLDITSKQILLVTNKQQQLLGTLTDGDIRRGLLKNLTILEPIKSIMNSQPIVGHTDDSYKANTYKLTANNLKQLPIVSRDNRIKDIIFLNELLAPIKKNAKVVLMAGGLGTRLRPLTNNVPKPMLKVGDYPILENIIRNFKAQGFENIIISVNYKKDIIKNYFQDGQILDVNIQYVDEEKRLGTAGALTLLGNVIDTDPLIVMNGDILTNLNFKQLLENHKSSKAVATICVTQYEYQVPYGIINKNTDNSLLSIEEKPTYKHLINAGIYVLNSEVIEFIPKDTFYDMPSLLKELIKKGLKVNVYTMDEYWLDIGKLEDFHKANSDMEENKI